ncbi:MAG: putative tricarboxylic transport rane protein [Thermomicrobiales bacterium]|jgi:putative tricarboxylic transport membrane protein|nr:putative tricarboxylic transport rane protein [Thermomicrobiales bacterium]
MRSLQSSGFVARILAVAILSVVVVPFAPPAIGSRTVVAQQTCDYPTDTIQIMAPAAPGGGWDTTAREVQQVLQGGIVNQSVEVFNVEGAGGTIGLAQLVSDHKGDPHTLMMMGMVMIGAIATNQSAVTLDDVTPIARLTAEFEVIVVPKDSKYQSLQDLIADFQADPGSISWAGGSAGGTDHILVGLIAKALGADPTAINYVPYSGGGEALAAILGGQVSAGVSGLGEWQDQIASGELRALAISGSAEAAAGTPTAEQASPVASGSEPPIPTLREQGIDVELANWRGIVAPPELSTEQRDCVAAVLQQMHDSQAWQDVLAKYGWQDYFLAGDEFAQFLPAERDRITGILKELGLVA